MADHNDIGYWGELKAAEYLEQQGYGIMARGWRLGHRDLDIVAHKDGVVAIVEVKTRRDTAFGEPELAVDRDKVRSLAVAAQAFVRRRRIRATLRFDIIAVVGEYGQPCTIRHIINAFLPQP